MRVSWRSRLSWWSWRDRTAVLVGLALPCGVAAALVPARSSFPNAGAALVLVAVVVAVAANGHRVAGIVASVSAAVWFDFFLTPPYERFTITHRSDLETTLLLVAVGVAVTEIAVRGRRQRVLAHTDALYLEAISSTAEVLASTASLSTATRHLGTQVSALLGLRDCRFERGRYGGLPRLEEDGRIRAGDDEWDIDQFGMPDTEVALLCTSDGTAFGRFVLQPTPGITPPLMARRIAGILAQQLAAVNVGRRTAA